MIRPEVLVEMNMPPDGGTTPKSKNDGSYKILSLLIAVYFVFSKLILPIQ